jgi:hypothetical protein
MDFKHGRSSLKNKSQDGLCQSAFIKICQNAFIKMINKSTLAETILTLSCIKSASKDIKMTRNNLEKPAQ